ncbi:probable inactive dual specificity protein phosphatase-like At4g18593 [Jatropha curcas]|uniref:probable inactive dual specificity protein phosphatase-like At4g18593 n=1 Tax=Jatropha curcas TaxID=180498 RepID=UPI0018934CDD|nr:probable inactive dual specificity protein phosphatase-like At4g18593 [Jatropha curcas]
MTTMDNSVSRPEIGVSNSHLDSVPKPQVIYRCKKCRRIVASEENIVPHERGKGEQCFKWKKRSGDPQEKETTECSSIFVEPMKWCKQYKKGLLEKAL